MTYLEHDIKGSIAVTTQLIEIEEIFNHLKFLIFYNFFENFNIFEFLKKIPEFF